MEMIGRTISHYKILEKLGEGGMGVVYKAEDTKLKRTTALKFLPTDLTRNPEAKERFIHEAQAASALDHPNICNIFEINETDDGLMFIAMACYDGETLKKKIERGPLPIDEAVSIASQVARGLEKAHASGIVHRDIKPANIVITKDSIAKILDFGLAKLSGKTLLTKTGMTLGTAAYMSPEQARSEATDLRSDIWSLGVVLYEMLTGQRPFQSDYEQALVYSILNEDPKPARDLRPDVPETLERITRRAMAKESSGRYQTAAEFIVDLESHKSGSRLSKETRRSPLQKPAMLKIGIAVILAAAAGIFVLFFKQTRLQINRNPITRIVHTQYSNTNDFEGAAPPFCLPGISRDGNWISLGAPDDSGRWNLYFMNVSWSEPHKIPIQGPLEYGAARISPGGDVIAFGAGAINIVSTSGGESTTIEDSILSLGHWTPDGTRIGYIRSHKKPFGPPVELWSVKKDGSDRRREFVDSLSASDIYPFASCWSPDGRSLAWIRAHPDGFSDLFTIDLSTGKENQLTFDKSYTDEPFWSSNGGIFYVSNKSGKWGLWAVPEGGGEPQRIILSGGENLGISVSADGKRLLVPESNAQTDIWISDLYKGHSRQIKLDQCVNGMRCSLSPDFSKLAYFKLDAVEGDGLWVADTDGKNRRRIATVKPNSFFASRGLSPWSLDGKWIAFTEYDAANHSRDLSIVEVSKPGMPKRITVYARRWAWIDGQSIVVQSRDMRTFQYSPQGTTPQQLFEDSTFARPILKGHFLLYQDFRKNHVGLWICRLDPQGRVTGRPRRFLSQERAVSSADSRVWLYEKKRGEVWKITLPECTEEYVGPIGQMGSLDFVRLNADGMKVAYLRQNVSMRLVLIENLFE